MSTLIGLERFFDWACPDARGIYFAFRLKTAVSRAQTVAATTILIDHVETLHFRIEDELDRMDNIDANDHVVAVIDDWMHDAATFLAGPPQRSWGFRVILAAGATTTHWLAFTGHHGLVDGQMAMNLVRMLANVLADPEAHVADVPFVRGHLALPWYVPWMLPLIRWMWVRGAAAGIPPGLIKGTTAKESKEVKTIVAFAQGPAVSDVLNACRAHGTTVGAAVIAATVRAGKTFAAAREAAGGHVDKIGIAFDMRHRGGDPAASMCITNLDVSTAGLPDDFWKAAKLLKSRADGEVNGIGAYAIQALCSSVHDFTGTLKSMGVDPMANAGVGSFLSVSSLGRMDVTHVDQAFMSTGPHRGAPLFLIWMLSVGDQTCFSVRSTSPASSQIEAEAFLAAVVEDMALNTASASSVE